MNVAIFYSISQVEIREDVESNRGVGSGVRFPKKSRIFAVVFSVNGTGASSPRVAVREEAPRGESQ